MVIKGKEINLLKLLYKFILIALGTFVLAFGASCFQIPFSIISGGVSGIGIIISSATGQDISVWITVLTWILFFVGLLILGPKFTLNTLISTILYPVFIMIFLKTSLGETLVSLIAGDKAIIAYEGGNVVITNLEKLDEARILLAGILGGSVIGIGCGLTFLGGGSSGGVDILSFILTKFTGIKESFFIFGIDGCIVLSGLIFNIIHHDMTLFFAGLIGIVSAYVCSLMVEKIYVNSQSALICDIVTSKVDDIVAFIHENLDRTATIFEATGAYSKENKSVIRVVVTKKQYIKIKDGLSKIDHNAFVTFTPCNFVTGEGFNKNKQSSDTLIGSVFNIIKSKIKKKDKD